MSLPFPTARELIIASEVLVVTYPLRWLMKWLETDLQRERRLIIAQHAQSHQHPLKSCQQEDCVLLTKKL